jgi:hypothetical protein
LQSLTTVAYGGFDVDAAGKIGKFVEPNTGANQDARDRPERPS